MGSGLLRERLILAKIGYGGVYVTDLVVATFLDPKVTSRGSCMLISIALRLRVLSSHVGSGLRGVARGDW